MTSSSSSSSSEQTTAPRTMPIKTTPTMLLRLSGEGIDPESAALPFTAPVSSSSSSLLPPMSSNPSTNTTTKSGSDDDRGSTTTRSSSRLLSRHATAAGPLSSSVSQDNDTTASTSRRRRRHRHRCSLSKQPTAASSTISAVAPDAAAYPPANEEAVATIWDQSSTTAAAAAARPFYGTRKRKSAPANATERRRRPSSEEDEEECSSSTVQINSLVRTLFEPNTPTPATRCGNSNPDDIASVLDQPCVSARIFACYVLYSKPDGTTVATDSVMTSSTIPTSNAETVSLNSINPILSLLQAMVRVEAISLRTLEPGVPREAAAAATAAANPMERSRLVHFSSFDGSCTRPPVDRQIGSALHRHNSILAMVDAMEHIQKSSTTPATSAAASIAANLADLSSFLTRHFINVDADAGDGEATTDNTATMLLAACSDAVALNFPWKRVQELAKLYCKDFSILQRRLDRSTIMVAKTPNISAESSSPASTHQFEKSIGPQKPMQELLLDDDDDNDEPLVMEECLAAFLGQAIRYQLRLLLNTAPPRLCKEDEEYEVRSLAYSQVCKLAILVPRSDASPDNAAAEDSFFSAIVSNALDHIFEYFGMEQMVGVDELVSSTIVPLSVASQRSLTLRNVEALKTTPLAEEDVDAVLQDIRDATSLLDVSRAVKFIIDLFNAPGVQDEIQRMSGWSPIESYATWSLKYSSWKLFPADSHLVALHNVKLLLQRLQAFYIKIASTIDDSEGDLQTVRKNYFVVDNGLAAARRSKACKAASEIPPLVEISKTWNEGMTRARYFPLVAVPKQVKRKPQK